MVVGKKGEAWAEELVTRNLAGKLVQGGLSQMVLETLSGKFGWKGMQIQNSAQTLQNTRTFV